MHILTKYFNGTVLTGTENIREVSHEHGGELFAGKKYLNYHDFIPYAPPPCEELFVTRPFATFHVLEMTWKRLGWVGVQYHPEGTEEGVDWLIAGMCGTRYSHGHRFEALQLRCSLSLAQRICGPLPD